MKNITISFIFLFLSLNIFAQGERKFIRKGNNDYEAMNYSNSQVAYEKAINEDPRSFEAGFNLGDALYKQAQQMLQKGDQENAMKKFEDAAGQFQSVINRKTNNTNVARAYHNMGNAYLNANKVAESIEAYKNALKNNPNDKESKYNLAYAQELQKQQQQQQQQNQDQNQDKQDKQDQQQNQNKQDQQQNQDKQDQQQNQDKQDQQQNQDQKDQQKNQEQQQQKEQEKKEQQQQQKEQKISKEDAERLLKALENDEKKVQKKVKKIKGQKIYIEKDW